MIIALTGTPGTGKTTIASALKQWDITVISLKELAIEHDFIESYDETRKSNILDIDAIENYLQANLDTNDLIVIESHLSHLLDLVELVIVLRCHPKELRKRLLKRNWSWNKIKENLEAEILDVILCESVEYHKNEYVWEIETSTKTSNQVAETIKQHFIDNNVSSDLRKPGSYDWSEYLFDSHIMEKEHHGP
jgi:adenylate kinase